MLDADVAGQAATARLVHALGCRVIPVELPQGVEDPADLVPVVEGNDIFCLAIRQAVDSRQFVSATCASVTHDRSFTDRELDRPGSSVNQAPSTAWITWPSHVQPCRVRRCQLEERIASPIAPAHAAPSRCQCGPRKGARRPQPTASQTPGNPDCPPNPLLTCDRLVDVVNPKESGGR